MVAVAGLLMPVIGWSWTKDPQAAGHDQGAVGLGGHAPVGVQVHAPRVPKAPTGRSHLTLEDVWADGLRDSGSGLSPRARRPACQNLPETMPCSATYSAVSLQSTTAVELQ
jgi:hypothetical protein